MSNQSYNIVLIKNCLLMVMGYSKDTLFSLQMHVSFLHQTHSIHHIIHTYISAIHT